MLPGCCRAFSPRPSWLQESASNVSYRSEGFFFAYVCRTTWGIPQMGLSLLLIQVFKHCRACHFRKESRKNKACVLCALADSGSLRRGEVRRTHGLRQTAVQRIWNQRSLQRHSSDSHERCVFTLFYTRSFSLFSFSLFQIARCPSIQHYFEVNTLNLCSCRNGKF